MTDLEAIMNLRRMRHLRRCNTLPTVISEDVAQHSYFVTMLAMAIGDEYNTYATEHNVGYHPCDDENLMIELNMEVVLRKSLCHDIEESFVSDIPYQVKHMDDVTHSLFETAIRGYVDRVFEGTDTMKMYQDFNIHCKDGLEGQLVAIVDMLELALYCWEECNMGNKAVKPVLDKAMKILPTLAAYDTFIYSSQLFSALIGVLEGDEAFQLKMEELYNVD